MDLANHVAALLEHLAAEDIVKMRPADRARFADQCRRIVALVDPTESRKADPGYGDTPFLRMLGRNLREG